MIISVFALREGLTEAPWFFVLRKEAAHEVTLALHNIHVQAFFRVSCSTLDLYSKICCDGFWIRCF